MSEIVSPDEIEGIVGAKRHPTYHIGCVSTERNGFYILHSAECRRTMADLRECTFSKALDRGVDKADFPEDTPVLLKIVKKHLDWEEYVPESE